MKMYLKLVLPGTISCLLFSSAYGDDAPRVKIVSDGITKTVTDGKTGKLIEMPVKRQQRMAPARGTDAEQGTTRLNPVSVNARKVFNFEDLQNVQSQYLSKHYPGFTWVGPATVKKDDLFLQQVTFRTKDGTVKSVFFDVTACFKKMKRDKRLKREIDALEEAAIKEEKLIKEGEKAVEESKGKEPKDIVVKASE